MGKKKAPTKKSPAEKVTPDSNKDKKISGEKESNFLIVGMGASAGGLEAFKTFFSAMPDKPGMAFVLVQHLDPTHKSLMAQLLEKHTPMKVAQVEDNTPVVKNHVYIIPPDKDMAIFNGVLHLMEPTAARGFRKPIDFFLRTLAEDQKEKAVGIILSGTGTEGTLGLKEIKGLGGLSIVQDPDSAKYDGMPRSAIASGAEDFILPVTEMPSVLMKYSLDRKIIPGDKLPEPYMAKQLLEKVFILLRNETGCNFGEYKNTTIIRRIEKRMALNQIGKLEDYIKYLQKHREEVTLLFKELLISVTGFFRDNAAFGILRDKVIPEIIQQKPDGGLVRIWVPGCASGEEAYSIAILFDEAIREQSKNIKVQIFASDLDEVAIDTARQGIYPETIAPDVGAERLRGYFRQETGFYRIRKEIRDQVIFAVHNLVKDPPFSKLDMVSCRNLLIYLNTEAQKKVLAVFHYALGPDGILFLGGSESLGEYANLYEVLDRKHKLFRRKTVPHDRMPDIGYLFRDPGPPKPSILPIQKRESNDSLAGMAEQLLLENYAPACTIINSQGECIYFMGDTGKYLQPSPGAARLNVVDMAREGLKTDLRAIIVKARKTLQTEMRKGIKVKTANDTHLIDLCIRPMAQLEPNGDYFMLTFEEQGTVFENTPEPISSNGEETSELHAVEQELAATKEYLRSTIEELEVSNEELKSSNEELQSSNEEMQSTNEELETSKEELQSVNEEMVTVNSELQGKIDELARAYDDMNNLLASTEIGTLFLDAELKIKRFTPPMSRIINLIRSDVGRPVGHLSSNLIYEGFLNDTKKVMRELTPFKTTIQSNMGTWYQMRIAPYKTSKNVIEGAVITFVDITQEKQFAEDLKQQKERYEQLLGMTKTTVHTQDKNLVYTSAADLHPNFQFKEMIGKTDKELFSAKDAAILGNIKKTVLKTEKPLRQTVSLVIGGQQRLYDLMVRPVFVDGEVNGIACTSMDITEIAESAKELIKPKKSGNG